MPHHIAIVEDEPSIAANYRDALQSRGFRVSLFAGREEAAAEWATAVQPIYDTWIADMAGKDIDGQALIDEAKALMAEYTAAN